MKIIVDGIETSAEDFRNKRDGRVISFYEVKPDEGVIIVETSPPTAHLPHVKRAS